MRITIRISNLHKKKCVCIAKKDGHITQKMSNSNNLNTKHKVYMLKDRMRNKNLKTYHQSLCLLTMEEAKNTLATCSLVAFLSKKD